MSAQDKHQIATWWAENPMTYGEDHGKAEYAEHGKVELGSPEFFGEVDRVFYNWNTPLHTAEGKFAKIFPYRQFKEKDVLEIGCGMGTMAMNWALQGARITAVDLNTTSIEQTRRRFDLFGLQGTIEQADGNRLPFTDGAFDYAYSWGVLHHSPDLALSLREMMRVLKPGAPFGVMLYYRTSVLYWLDIRLQEGFVHGESLFLNNLELSSRYTDGNREEGNPHTWPVIRSEISDMLKGQAHELKFKILGTDLDYELPQTIPLPGLNSWLPRSWKKALARRFGWSLWFTGKRI
jgi:SAM-dependent methyltransferase